MKKVILLLILGFDCSISYPQIYEHVREELIRNCPKISLYHDSISCYLYKYSTDDDTYFLDDTTFYLKLLSYQDTPPHGTIVCYLYSGQARLNKIGQLFQSLYEWLMAVENFALRHCAEAAVGHLGDRYIKIDYPWVYIANEDRDTFVPVIPLKIEMIRHCKESLIEYAKCHNVNIIP